MIARRLAATVLTVVAAAAFGACGGSDDPSAEAPTTARADADVVPSPEAASDTAADEPSSPSIAVTASTAAPTTAAPTTAAAGTVPATQAPTTATAPDALQQLPGVASIALSVEGTDPARPTFSWTAPAGATDFQLVVQADDGTPLWAWTGEDTAVVLGGAQRAPEVEGPSLRGPSRARVFALAGGALVADSGWVPVGG